MTAEQFNEKYKEYLEEGFYGLGFDNESVVNYLDDIFKDLILIPGFKYKQIKLKFGTARFYSTLSSKLQYSIEETINDLVNERGSIHRYNP